MFDTSQATFTLQVLPDDPRDDAHGYATFHIVSAAPTCPEKAELN